jgi:hypothetical protein
LKTRPDWPAIIGRLRERGVDIERHLGVSRTTVWRWAIGEVRPSGDNAVDLLAMERLSAPVSPVQQVWA